jgi:hypothetical protein
MKAAVAAEAAVVVAAVAAEAAAVVAAAVAEAAAVVAAAVAEAEAAEAKAVLVGTPDRRSVSRSRASRPVPRALPEPKSRMPELPFGARQSPGPKRQG